MRTIMNKTKKHICGSDKSRRTLFNKLYAKALMIKYYLLTTSGCGNTIDKIRDLFNIILTFGNN